MPTPAADALEAARATGTAAFSKFMSVLQLIADAKDAPSVPQLAAASGFPRPTVYRIVGALMAEGLVVESRRAGRHAGENGRFIEVAIALATRDDPGAIGHGLPDLRLDALGSAGVDQRADIGLGVEGIADLERLRALGDGG